MLRTEVASSSTSVWISMPTVMDAVKQAKYATEYVPQFFPFFVLPTVYRMRLKLVFKSQFQIDVDKFLVRL